METDDFYSWWSPGDIEMDGAEMESGWWRVTTLHSSDLMWQGGDRPIRAALRLTLMIRDVSAPCPILCNILSAASLTKHKARCEVIANEEEKTSLLCLIWGWRGRKQLLVEVFASWMLLIKEQKEEEFASERGDQGWVSLPHSNMHVFVLYSRMFPLSIIVFAYVLFRQKSSQALLSALFAAQDDNNNENSENTVKISHGYERL